MQVRGRFVGGNVCISCNESIKKKGRIPPWRDLGESVLGLAAASQPHAGITASSSMDGQALGHGETAGRLRQHCLELVRQQTPMMKRSFPALKVPMGIFFKQGTRNLGLSGLHSVEGRAVCLHPSPMDEPLEVSVEAAPAIRTGPGGAALLEKFHLSR